MLVASINKNSAEVANYINSHNVIKSSDPQLLVTASTRLGKVQVKAQSCPGAATRFAKGFMSYPMTWWATHIHTAMLKGLFGKKQQSVAQIRQNILAAILYEAKKNKIKTLKVAQFYAKHKLSSDKAGFAGRILGGVFTNYTTTRVPGKKKSSLNGKQKAAVSMTNFILSSYGAAIFAIAKGARKFEEIVMMILTGDYNATICLDMGRFDLQAIPALQYEKDKHGLIFDLLDGVDQLNQKHRNNLTPINEFRN